MHGALMAIAMPEWDPVTEEYVRKVLPQTSCRYHAGRWLAGHPHAYAERNRHSIVIYDCIDCVARACSMPTLLCSAGLVYVLQHILVVTNHPRIAPWFIAWALCSL